MVAPDEQTVDAAVLYLGRDVGMLFNQRRRAGAPGCQPRGWVAAHRRPRRTLRSLRRVDATRGLAAIHALFSAGRMTADLREAYRKEFE